MGSVFKLAEIEWTGLRRDVFNFFYEIIQTRVNRNDAVNKKIFIFSVLSHFPFCTPNNARNSFF